MSILCRFGLWLVLWLTFSAGPGLASDGEERIGDQATSTSLAIGHWKNACREGAGSPSACAKLGGAFFVGYDSVKPNIGEGLRYETYACEGGLPSACTDVANMYHKLGRYSEARTAYRTACNAGDGGGCRNLAVMMTTGQGGPVDFGGSKEMSTKACTMGVSDMCQMARRPGPTGYDEFHAAFARAEARDVPGMIALMKTSCFERGYYDACDLIARWSLDGTQWPKDISLGRAGLKQACALDPSKGCARYAEMILRGEGGAMSTPEAFTLYQRACDAGDRDGCYGVASMMYAGQVGVVEMPVIVDHLNRACRDNGLSACALLAKILRHGEGNIAANPERARDLYLQDCNTRFGQSCFEYATMLMKGELGGPSPDQRRYAKDAFERACRTGVVAACDAAKTTSDPAP
ncbi:tetratricopeptide repeat protein [Asticcacaulis sp. YBE204]|uniref:tetratricopeptide repeat protein n=1 Tax=Asticcacaulis sp. YBE204 TaxID=1282363 RepID=UPI0003C3DD63|nr:SEL1-like repeat protein [Asticcacaulis sp. YBE204]ESQ79205.1 hypothetical protein AEYBE204_09355 [Asticcacaulis sp. YBE204]